MEEHQKIWQNWAEFLQRWQLQDFIVTLLDATEPLNLFCAQVVYIGQPFLKHLMPEAHVNALANLLENRQQTQEFTNFLQHYVSSQ